MTQDSTAKAEHAAQSILNTAYKLLGNPIVMIDTSYNLLARTENTVSDDPLCNELVGNGRFTHETVDFFNTAGFIQAVAGSDVVALLVCDSLKYDRACAKFFDRDGVQLGSIVVVACYRPFEPQDFVNMALTCEMISEVVRRDEFRMTERVLSESIIDDLLNAREDGRIAALRAELKPYIYVAVADVSEYEHTLSHLAYFRDVFSRLQREYRYFIHLNNIVMLISTDHDLININRDLTELSGFFARYRVFAGISSAFAELASFRERYTQALDALNHGMEHNSGQHIFKYDTFRVDSYLNAVKDSAQLRELCNPVVARIMEDDAAHGTRNADTLRAYITCGGNDALTCDRTGLAPEELSAWRREMELRYDIDCDDGNLLFSLLASYKVTDCL
ncbi:MAG: hypothetical protein LBN02_07275 [Oscillospiraceae bacterium]|jgi:hypothetical protein|nr:hypothetical protein [Oscillospiraceae bacterium]